MTAGLAPVGVLLSGRGSNFVALAEAMERGEVPARIVLVASNQPRAAGLDAARQRGLTTLALDHRQVAGRAAHDARMVEALRQAGAEWVCLAGYMRILGPGFVEAFPHRILNIHPSLLPAFPGLDAQRQALEHGVCVAGCTVHLVDHGLDSGPIVEQRIVPVEDGDDVASLAARILEQEHAAYPAALARLLREPWTVEGRRLRFGGRDTTRQKTLE